MTVRSFFAAELVRDNLGSEISTNIGQKKGTYIVPTGRKGMVVVPIGRRGTGITIDPTG